MIITIDGPAGSGKSTIAEILSKKLGFIHFNSGSLYRAVAVFLKNSDMDFSKFNNNTVLPKLKLKVKYILGEMNVFVNKMNCTAHLRDNDISIIAPTVSTNIYVRNVIDNYQRKFAKKNNIVVDGRDVGSHVFPNAEIKFYLDCSLKERAKRRQAEELLKGNKITLKALMEQINARDEIDKNKTYAPLVVPKDAVIIDSTNLTINQVVENMLNFVR